jgi:hypothetical protein
MFMNEPVVDRPETVKKIIKRTPETSQALHQAGTAPKTLSTPYVAYLRSSNAQTPSSLSVLCFIVSNSQDGQEAYILLGK